MEPFTLRWSIFEAAHLPCDARRIYAGSQSVSSASACTSRSEADHHASPKPEPEDRRTKERGVLSTRYHDVMPDGESERARVRADESEGKQACSECCLLYTSDAADDM
eukprot:3475497-Rhodomonas_salina.2